jgi:N-ethylmaleimide reductase
MRMTTYSKDSMTSTLWQPIDLGAIHLEHRLAMAPMTRARSTTKGVPTEMNATYYAQRASMAVIISEGTQPSEDGQGYPLTPGIYNTAQIEGWRLVTDAVHRAGGRIIIQLMHTGRIGHPLNTRHGRQPVAPSRVKPAGKMFTSVGTFEMPEPRPLSVHEITDTVRDHRRAAWAAMEAGADGVEIHAANGYLIHQFLSSNANQRSDHYAGSVENRIRVALEVASGVAEEIGGDRTGIIISPGNPLNDIVESDVEDLYLALVHELGSLGLAYLNVVHGGDDDLVHAIRRDWTSALLLNRNGADIETRINDIESGLADVITVGTHSLANPDLIARIKSGAPLNDADRSTFYGGDERGYIDYPTMGTS